MQLNLRQFQATVVLFFVGTCQTAHIVLNCSAINKQKLVSTHLSFFLAFFFINLCASGIIS